MVFISMANETKLYDMCANNSLLNLVIFFKYLKKVNFFS